MRVVIDTGPLVAYFNSRDRFHRWVVDQMRNLSGPLLTCEPVLAEACFLIQRGGGQPGLLIEKLHQGVIEIGLQVAKEVASIAALLSRYADTPMSLADACIVRLAEIHADCKVFTLDSDFRHYRRNARHVIPLLTPQQ